MSFKHVVNAVNAVLFEQWDPIGVHTIDPDGPRDEYESYVPHILSLIEAGADDQAIAKHLEQLETKRMGLAASPLEHRLAVAQRIRAALREVEQAPPCGLTNRCTGRAQ